MADSLTVARAQLSRAEFLEAIAEREAATETSSVPTGPRVSATDTEQNDR